MKSHRFFMAQSTIRRALAAATLGVGVLALSTKFRFMGVKQRRMTASLARLSITAFSAALLAVLTPNFTVLSSVAMASEYSFRTVVLAARDGTGDPAPNTGATFSFFVRSEIERNPRLNNAGATAFDGFLQGVSGRLTNSAVIVSVTCYRDEQGGNVDKQVKSREETGAPRPCSQDTGSKICTNRLLASAFEAV